MIEIIPFNPDYQAEISRMMERIQAEFKEAITTRHSTVITDVYQEPDQKFWIALDPANRVAGTVGIKLGHGYSEIKRMFVDPAFRGSEFATAKRLLSEAINYSKTKKINVIYLGTMSQFIGAQRFYQKSGFTKIHQNELPESYKLNPMDSIFYKMEL